MDKLDTCMICEEPFKEGDSTISVKDAIYRGFYHDDNLAYHEHLEEPDRGVYCSSCYDKMPVIEWLSRVAQKGGN